MSISEKFVPHSGEKKIIRQLEAESLNIFFLAENQRKRDEQRSNYRHKRDNGDIRK